MHDLSILYYYCYSANNEVVGCLCRMYLLRQGSNFESCVWRTVSSQSSHHPQEVLLAQFSLYVHKGGLKPDSFHLPTRIGFGLVEMGISINPKPVRYIETRSLIDFEGLELANNKI